MIDCELLKEMIEDAKAVKLLVLSWNEGQFWGTMKWKQPYDGTVERDSCNCRFCGQKGILLESSASHAKYCTKPGPKMPISFSEAIEDRFPGKTYRL